MKSFEKTVFLLYLFAYLQVTPAFEEFSNEEYEESDSSMEENPLKVRSIANTNLIRKKRGLFFRLKVIPSATTVFVVKKYVKPAINGLRDKIFGKTDAPSPIASEVDTSLVIGKAISSAISTAEADATGPNSIGLPNEKNHLDAVAFDLRIIDRKLNKNFENAVKFKQTVTKMDPSAEAQILVRKEGFQCDEELCREAGDGMHAIGICSPYFCECDNENASGMKCADDAVYDPIYQICDDPRHIKICGF